MGLFVYQKTPKFYKLLSPIHILMVASYVIATAALIHIDRRETSVQSTSQGPLNINSRKGG